MKATLKDRVIAESDDIVEQGGYPYFPISVARMEWLEKAAKTESDRACPHDVQFYDVVIDGNRFERAGRRVALVVASRPMLIHCPGVVIVRTGFARAL